MNTQSPLKISFNSILLLALILGTGVTPVSAVRNAAPLAAVSSLVACSNVAFAAPAVIAVGNFASSVAVGHFNSDGNQDIAVTNAQSNNVSILLGNGAGSFGPATPFPAGTNPVDVKIGDFNRDGNQDLVVSNNYGGVSPDIGISILLGNGVGSFAAPMFFSNGGSQSGGLAVGDFNEDSKQDVATANGLTSDNKNVSIFLGTGTGSFSTATLLPAKAYPVTLAVSDFNRDGHQDLAMGTFYTYNNISVILGNGTGSFGEGTLFPAGIPPAFEPNWVRVGDFNSDGNQDLVTSTNHHYVSILFGNGAGGFSPQMNVDTVDTFPYGLVVGDFNGDGKQDVATANGATTANVSILMGNGAGNFAAAMDFSTGAGTVPIVIELGDFNGDGKQDLVTANHQTNNVSILLNTCSGSASQTFADVPMDYWARSFIERLYDAGITGGCNTNPLQYCPEGTVTRGQMAVFLLRGIHGSAYNPPAVGSSTGFSDVPPTYWAAAWIKRLAAEGITGGCGAGTYCPEAPVTRAQMAVFLLRSKHGASYNPPAVGGSTGFSDVSPSYWAAAWIKQLVAEGITSGCGTGTYCPEAPVTRAQMAVFLVRTFALTP